MNEGEGVNVGVGLALSIAISLSCSVVTLWSSLTFGGEGGVRSSLIMTFRGEDLGSGVCRFGFRALVW